MRKLDILRTVCKNIANGKQPQIPFEAFRKKGDTKPPALWDVIIDQDYDPITKAPVGKPYTEVTFRHENKDGIYLHTYRLPYYPKLDNTTLQGAIERHGFPVTPATLNIGFLNRDKRQDETQFDLAENEGMPELERLWADFCKENAIAENTVLYVETAWTEIKGYVPYQEH